MVGNHRGADLARVYIKKARQPSARVRTRIAATIWLWAELLARELNIDWADTGWWRDGVLIRRNTR
jgi:hypothetical protein